MFEHQSFLDPKAAVDTWRGWGLPLIARPTLVGPVLGGRTNRSFLLHGPGLQHDLLLRINNPQGDKLGINRADEAKILQAVADAGLTCGACYWDTAQRFTVFPHINARTWSPQDFAQANQRRRVLEQVEVAHQLSPDTPRRRYYHYLDHYWQQLEQAGALDDRLRREWHAFVPDLQAFDQGLWPARLTHHDLIPENVLETHDRIYLIDWEYAALGHPDIDLWCLDPKLVREPFIHELAHWTNALWERVVKLQHIPFL